jgi:hypothetical protein
MNLRPERAPQTPSRLGGIGGVKGHNMKQNYLTGKLRRACPVLTGWPESFTLESTSYPA